MTDTKTFEQMVAEKTATAKAARLETLVNIQVKLDAARHDAEVSHKALMAKMDAHAKKIKDTVDNLDNLTDKEISENIKALQTIPF